MQKHDEKLTTKCP